MSFFLAVPKGEPAEQLARRVGAARLSSERALELLAMFSEEAGWRFLDVPNGDPGWPVSELREVAARALALADGGRTRSSWRGSRSRGCKGLWRILLPSGSC
jgi:hypothetical protein